MENKLSSSSSTMFIVVLLLVFLRPSVTTTLVVEDTIPRLHFIKLLVGDSLVFKFKDVHSKRAFQRCNLGTPTLLHTADSTARLKWQPSVPGSYHFSFGNGSSLSRCEDDRSLEVRVAAIASELRYPPLPSSPAPSPTVGGDLHLSPLPPPHELAFPRPTSSPEPSAVPLPDDNHSASSALHSHLPSLPGSTGIVMTPFISSNPVVPLPTEDTSNTNAIHPLPVTGHGNQVKMGRNRIRIHIIELGIFAFCILHNVDNSIFLWI